MKWPHPPIGVLQWLEKQARILMDEPVPAHMVGTDGAFFHRNLSDAHFWSMVEYQYFPDAGVLALWITHDGRPLLRPGGPIVVGKNIHPQSDTEYIAGRKPDGLQVLAVPSESKALIDEVRKEYYAPLCRP